MARATAKKAPAKRKPAAKKTSNPVAKRSVKSASRSVKPASKARHPVAARKTAKAATARKPRGATKRVPPVRAATPGRAVPDGSAMRWTDTLRDGTHVIIRAIGRKDVELERAFIERLSPESRRMRFLGQIGKPSDEMLRKLTDIDYKNEMAFIALVHRDGKTQEIGVSRYSASADGKFCECAITVDDEWHNKGLATLLMHHLIDVARARGISTMVSYDAIDNGPMRELATFLGFKRKSDPEDSSMVTHSLSL